MWSLGTAIVPRLHVEKAYTTIFVIILSITLFFILINFISYKKILGVKVLLLVLLMVQASILWPYSDRTTVTLKNNSGMELTDITITDPYESGEISHLDVEETLTVPATLNVEGGTLRIKGQLGSGKAFNSETILAEMWYTKKILIF